MKNVIGIVLISLTLASCGAKQNAEAQREQCYDYNYWFELCGRMPFNEGQDCAQVAKTLSKC